jgi:two-component system chemotaxis response regulator CheB
MDGLTAIPKLLDVDPQLKIVMASTLTLQNASASLTALSLGASDYVPKPTSASAINGTAAFKREIVAKVKTLGGIRRDARGEGRPRVDGKDTAPEGGSPTRRAAAPTADCAIPIRRNVELPPAAIAIGSSTGGPQALSSLLDKLPQGLRLPILVTQHMPPTFTTILAQHLAKSSGIPAAEAIDGEQVHGGRIYVAPGDFHMIPVIEGSVVRLRLTRDAPENFCRPSVDPMFRAATKVWGGRVIGIILTGMGKDGLAGGQALVDAGGTLVAQDEKTSVVWGMPGAVATAGLCSAVLPLPELARWLHRRLG